VVVPTQRDVARELRALHLRTLQDLITQSGQLMDAAAMLRLRDALLLEWLRAIAPQVDVSGLQRVAQRRQWVDQACALALADPANPPTMQALSGHLGVSPRTLQQAFGEVLGHSPAKYLRAVRLNGVRRALRLAARQGWGCMTWPHAGASGTRASLPATTNASSASCLRPPCWPGLRPEVFVAAR
jgi:AraC family ethanolamine operon transcriptional activator